jgi:excisionase family DNA binding protein
VGEDRTGRPGPTDQQLTVPEAAELLGITVEAVRMRIKRGTLRSERRDGRVFVVLGPDRPTERTPEGSGESGALTSQMQARIESLEHQLEEANERDRENRRIIAALTSRIPAIEAPSQAEASEAAETVEEPRPATGESQESVQRSWWRRVFGG